MNNTKKEDLIRKSGNISQICSITPVKYTEGKASGLNAYIVDNGIFNFCIAKDKCLDILKLSYKGMNLSYLCKNGIVSNKLANTDGYQFENSFSGGFLYTCGLDNIGDAKDGLITHGTIGNIPAENIKAQTYWNGDDYNIEIEGEMHSSALFKNELVLKRKISTKYNSNKIVLTDTIKNNGFSDADYMLLYHFNLGYPFLDEDVKIIVNTESTELFTEKGDISKAFTISQPIDNKKSEVFFHKLKDKNVNISVINEKLGVKICFSYDTKNLPYLVEWKSMGSGDYVLGIEPSTSFLGDKRKSAIIPPQSEIENIIEISIDNI